MKPHAAKDEGFVAGNASMLEHLIHLDTLTSLSGHLTRKCEAAVMFKMLLF
jgi:hypothetical protein